MPLRYKINIVQKLKDKGYNATKIRDDNLFSQSTLTKFRNGQGVDWKNLEQVCKLLHCQPKDIIEYVPDEPKKESDS